jgi:hypothetical protein
MRLISRRAALAVPCAVASTRSTLAAPPRPVLVELFTSQGCSSCPPADAVLSELAGRDDVLALGYHVDYWDRPGWRDPFSLREATQRQRAYAARLGLSFVYTPQAVVDGRADVIGSDRDKLTAAIAAVQPTARVGLELRREGTEVLLREAVGAAPVAAIMLVTFTPRHTTRVLRGENSGRTLTHSNIVRAIHPLDPAPAWRVTVDPALGVAAIAEDAQGAVLGLARVPPVD